MKQATQSAAAVRPSDIDKRKLLLQRDPALLGASWALHYCEAVQQSGRKIEGGWPGTLPEARMRVQSQLTEELRAQGLSPLSHQELVAATAIAYDEAKRKWQLASKRRVSAPAALSERSKR